jgi:hypothetical protein
VFIRPRFSSCFYAFRWSLTPSSGRLNPITIPSLTVIIFTFNCNKLITQKRCIQFSNSLWSTQKHDDVQAWSKCRREKDAICLLSTHECAFRVFHVEQFRKVKEELRQLNPATRHWNTQYGCGINNSSVLKSSWQNGNKCCTVIIMRSIWFQQCC